jgi:3',5'-cyclic-AMP phosphodiesterase
MTIEIAQLSDPHVQDPGIDPEAAQRFADSLAGIAAEIGSGGRVLITGDLAANGQLAEYEAVAQVLAASGLAAHVLPGNHDDRALLFGSVPPGPGEQRTDLRSRMPSRCDLGEVVVLMLDSLVEGSSHGELGAAQLEWLDAELSAAPDIVHLLGLHHPPFAIGVAGIDRVGLTDAKLLAEVLRRHGNVGRVLTGHVHRAVTASFAGVVVTTCPSTWRSLALSPIPGASYERPSQELGLLHRADAGTVITHVVSLPTRPAG